MPPRILREVHPLRPQRPLVRLVARLRPIALRATGAYSAMLLASALTLAVPLVIRALVDAAIGERPDALGFLGDGLDERGRLVAGGTAARRRLPRPRGRLVRAALRHGVGRAHGGDRAAT